MIFGTRHREGAFEVQALRPGVQRAANILAEAPDAIFSVDAAARAVPIDAAVWRQLYPAAGLPANGEFSS